MGPSSMSSAKFFPEFLEARESREAELMRTLERARPSTIMLSLNIPGPDKDIPGARELFAEGAAQLVATGKFSLIDDALDCLGPYAFFSSELEPEAAKHACMQIEDARPSFRLLDLDVYSAQGAPVSRHQLGKTRRPCLVCSQAAVDCIRQRTHTALELDDRVRALLCSVTD